ncbi:leucine-rich repeat-containing G-protein coupled receptor 4-like [Wyeomyia smithii]|uniref:leucine-rich repeat-containing G-protein coupled receptor 4-like n=1 Tax=Wyeomyia smithii TaxID=174621 RepID=UPI0024680B92|nr:leucine-rich repeat-containing G-protein coupled receptor 4-like [Wyeomyia smithii]
MMDLKCTIVVLSFFVIVNVALARDYRCTVEGNSCLFRDVQLKTSELLAKATFSSNTDSPKSVRFESSSMFQLPAAVFQKFPNIEVFDGSYSGIKALQSGSFLSATRIREVNLTGNKISALGNNLFDGAGKINSLDLAQNDISDVSANAFGGLSQLKKLNLSSNRIAALSPNVFTPLVAVEVVELQHNMLSKIDDGLFTSCTELITLNVSHNALQKFELRQFLREWSVDAIDVSHNRLKTVSIPKNLRKLVASNNQIQSVEALGKEPALIFLRLSYNRLTSIEQIPNLNKLVTLDLSYNQLETFDFNSVKKFKNLILLKLDGNKIASISNTLVNDVRYVKYIHLAHNRLTRFDMDTFRTLPRIIKLDVGYNQLTEFNAKRIGDKFPVLVRLILDGNDFLCDRVGELTNELKHAITEYRSTIEKCKAGQRLVDGICCK